MEFAVHRAIYLCLNGFLLVQFASHLDVCINIGLLVVASIQKSIIIICLYNSTTALLVP